MNKNYFKILYIPSNTRLDFINGPNLPDVKLGHKNKSVYIITLTYNNENHNHRVRKNWHKNTFEYNYSNNKPYSIEEITEDDYNKSIAFFHLLRAKTNILYL